MNSHIVVLALAVIVFFAVSIPFERWLKHRGYKGFKVWIAGWFVGFTAMMAVMLVGAWVAVGLEAA